jgi:putative tryptophan/tyrosine transport system substrate-binding protein
MRRREFIALAGAAYPVAVLAQRPETVRRVGILMPYPEGDGEVQARVATFREELRKLGWLQGENLRIYERWATDNLDRLRADSADLVTAGVDVVFTTGGRVLRAIQQQTGSVPIVFAAVTDPLGQGLVASLARPGGTITGISSPEFSVAAKLPEILKQLAPRVIRAAFVNNPENPSAAFIAREFTLPPSRLAWSRFSFRCVTPRIWIAPSKRLQGSPTGAWFSHLT